MGDMTISNSLIEFKNSLSQKKRSENTIRGYSNGLALFESSLKKQGITPETVRVSLVSADWFHSFIEDIDHFAPRTFTLYVQAVKQWFIFISEHYHSPIDIKKVKEIIDQSRKTPKISTQPDFSEVVRVIDYLTDEKEVATRKGNELLRFLRDRAIILLLSDTGIDLEAICSMNCQNVDFKKVSVSYVNGEQDEVVSIPRRTAQAIKTYLDERYLGSPTSGKSRTAPLFARHDKIAGKKEQSISTSTIRNIVKDRAREIFKVEVSHLRISPIWFRKYYEKNITRSLYTLLHPKIIDRCLRLYEDEHYQSAVFDAMKVIEIEIRNKLISSEKLYGVDLIGFAFGGDNPRVLLRDEKKEHDAARGLFLGAVTLMRNPLGHKFLDDTDQIKALECLSFASLLMRMLDNVRIEKSGS